MHYYIKILALTLSVRGSFYITIRRILQSPPKKGGTFMNLSLKMKRAEAWKRASLSLLTSSAQNLSVALEKELAFRSLHGRWTSLQGTIIDGFCTSVLQ
jgi:hypothetical protein